MKKNFALIVTGLLFALLFGAGVAVYGFKLSTFLNLFNTNAYLIIVSVGVTFVLLTGGIDISVASNVAFTCMFLAVTMRAGLSPLLMIPLALAVGTGAGLLMGYLIQNFNLQPFIVTLAGQFFLRGLCAVISTESIAISNSFYTFMSLGKITLGRGNNIYFYVFIALAILAGAGFILNFTKFGRGVYAAGGSEQSALLMGLPVKRIKTLVYAVSGFCAALGGVVYSFGTPAGYSLQNMGLEMDAISSAVIGGTLLSGGAGTVAGTTLGVLIQGIIQTSVTYQNLNTWWTKVMNAALLCVFIAIQRVLAARAEKAKTAKPAISKA